MTVKVETDTAQVATYFTGLDQVSNAGMTDASLSAIDGNIDTRLECVDLTTNDDNPLVDMSPTQQNYSSTSTDSLDTAEVRLDIKKFSQLLHSQQAHAEKMVFSEFNRMAMTHVRRVLSFEQIFVIIVCYTSVLLLNISSYNVLYLPFNCET
jgi:hypothetical protein